ncbi:LysR family transcriptional regulator [Colwellia psychrerythraea]|uniref:Transcriptional regulator, LysR family n=1 Tax=Colwellia psychrerythraea TaxID=28229 RepID=A0A099KNB6_COLPS|nr:LysR family transcriptional regulator [Colwellia psychrerythraea]KGJ91715.1 transcriptional regulator, LysR family [Colwellia psychrerythraea]
MSISIKRLQLFEATARLGKLTKAADELALSQSAASQALKELEQSLGYPLFERVGRDLLITENGVKALPKVRQIADLLDSLKLANLNTMSGVLRIVASATIATYLLPKLIAKFVKIYPEVAPEIHIGNTQMVIDHLDKGKASIGLIEGPTVHRHLQITPWQADKLQVFCPPNHPLATKAVISLEQLQQQTWILREHGSGTRAIFDAAIEQVGAQINLGIELTRQSAIKESVKAGLGLGCLSQLSIAEELNNGGLVALKSPLNLSRRFSLVTNKEYQHNLLTQTFIDFLLKMN